MKRLVWLLLVAFCTALAQVQPVERLVQPEACDCCRTKAGACGMPDCAVPMSAIAGVTVAPSASLRAKAPRVLSKSRRFADCLLVWFAPRPAVPAEIAPHAAAPVASVPAFKAHCSFLI